MPSLWHHHQRLRSENNGAANSNANSIANSNSLDNATHQLLGSCRQSNPDLRQVGNDQNVTVNGRAAKSVMMLGPSPLKDSKNQPERERDWLVVTHVLTARCSTSYSSRQTRISPAATLIRKDAAQPTQQVGTRFREEGSRPAAHQGGFFCALDFY